MFDFYHVFCFGFGDADTYFGPGTVDIIKCHLNAEDSNVKCCVNVM